LTVADLYPAAEYSLGGLDGPLVARVSDKQSIARIAQIINNSMMTSGEKCGASCYARPNGREHHLKKSIVSQFIIVFHNDPRNYD